MFWKNIGRVWTAWRQAMAVKSLLQILGWWSILGGVISAILAAIAAKLAAAPVWAKVAIGCGVFSLASGGLLLFACVIRVFCRFSKTSPIIEFDGEGLVADDISLTTPVDPKILGASGAVVSVGDRRYHSLRVLLRNNPVEVSANSRTDILASIEFWVNDVRCLSIDGRWADGPKPGEVPVADMLRMTFGAGDRHELDIAFKYLHDDHCYAMNHLSYRSDGFRYPPNMMPRGKICAVASLKGAGVHRIIKAVFINPGVGERLIRVSCNLEDIYF
jgi:hypothetical protein